MAFTLRRLQSSFVRSIVRLNSAKNVSAVSARQLQLLPAVNSRCLSMFQNGRPSSLCAVPINVNQSSVRHGHKPPLTYDFVRERILLVLRLYDKIDPEKLTIDSHFYNDLGLDSLDHVEVIMTIEDEFGFEIPDVDAEKLNTPSDILKYISIKEECYPELEHHGHDDHGHGDHGHGHGKDHH